MSTPHQGPGMWQQGDERAALAWLANLDQNQQQALRRSMQTHQALGPIYNAVNRVSQVFRQTAARLSEYAQRLASSTREFGQNTATRAGEVRQATTTRATEFGQNTATRATGLGQQAADLGRRGVEAVAGAGRQAVAATSNFGQRVAEGGRQAAASVSRWFQETRTNASTRAQAAGAAYQAFRNDPSLGQSGMTQKDVLELGQKFHALVCAQTPEARAAAAQGLVQAAEGLRTNNPQTQTQQGQAQAQQPGTGQHRAENPAWALQGTAPASEAVAKAPTGQQSEAANPGANKPRETGQER